MNKSVQAILVSILTLVAVGLVIFTVYYLLSNKDVNKVPVKELDIKVTLDTLPNTDGILTELKYKDFTKLFQTSKRSILVVTKTGCGYCEEFLPELKSALGNLGISAYEVNMSNLDKTENIGNYLVVTGTPITYIIENGNVVHTFSGSTDAKTIEAFLDLYYVRDKRSFLTKL